MNTINEKRGHIFEKVQEGAFEMFGRKEKKGKKMKKIKLIYIKLDFRTPSNHNSVIVGNFNTPNVLKIMS